MKQLLFGAAYLAGLAVGYWESQEEIAKQWVIDQAFKPKMAEKTEKNLYDGWKKAVKAAMAFK